MFLSEELAEGHNLDEFESGKPALDLWLRSSAHHAKDMRTGRTFVWHAGDMVVVAYYTLVGHKIAREDTAKKIGRGSPRQVPAVLLARLALDRALHGRKLGRAILTEALGKAVESSKLVAARVVVVDAIDDEAAAFYQRYGFVPVPGNPHLLAQKMKDIEQAMGG